MTKFQVQRKHSNIGLFIVISLAYIALLLLFGWQTWQFVNFLFPDDQLLMKLLTVFSFDVMALIWGCAHIFYRFAHPHAKTAVAWGWAITNILSLIATVIYMVIQSMFRFHITISNDVVNFGYGVTITALVFNLGMIAVFLYKEITTRFPNDDEFEYVDKPRISLDQQLAEYVGDTGKTLAQLRQENAAARTPVQDAQANDDFVAFMRWRDQQASTPVQPTKTFTEEQLRKAMSEAYDKGAEHAKEQSSPLQQPQVDTSGSHPGTNGNQ